MANWAITDYVVEGPKETLKKILEAIQHPTVVDPNSSEGWEGNVLNSLGIKWDTEKYMRGFIQDPEGISNPEQTDVLCFWAKEAWGATDFHEVLEKGISDIKVYYCVVEEGGEVFATNDRKGRYFPYKWHLDACIKDNYLYDDFIDEESMYNWLSNETKGEIKSKEDVEKFNDDNEDSDDYISIWEFSIVTD